MDYSLVHPLKVSGDSRWKTPISEIAIHANKGIITYFGDSPLMKLSIPGPMNELMKSTRAFMKSLPGLEVDTRTDLVSEQQLSGSYNQEEGLLLGADTYINLMGAQVSVFMNTGAFAPVLEPVDKNWLPEPDKEVTVRARVRGQKAPALKWRFTMYEVTHERGNCTNCPSDDSGDSEDPDLEFNTEGSPFGAPKKTSETSWEIETREPEREVEVKVTATDSGAWARLKAEVLAGDTWGVVGVETESAGGDDTDSITIPVDVVNGSNTIADAWEENQGIAVGSDRGLDEDQEPHSSHPGDGLSLYEEYRGFHIAGSLVRTDPRKKDLFFYVEDGLDSKVRAAMAPTDLRVHLVEEKEMVSKGVRIINNNSGDYRVAVQHGLYVARRPLGGDLIGRACSDELECVCVAAAASAEQGDCDQNANDSQSQACKNRV